MLGGGKKGLLGVGVFLPPAVSWVHLDDSLYQVSPPQKDLPEDAACLTRCSRGWGGNLILSPWEIRAGYL